MMRAIRTCSFSALVAVAACGGSSNKDVDAMVMIVPDAPPDAPPDAFEPTFDFSCAGDPQGTAAANVTLAGFAAELTVGLGGPELAPAHDATVDVCAAVSATCMGNDQLDTLTTPASGCPATGCPFTTDMLATGGSPLDVYVKVTKGTNYPTYIYPSSPVIADVTNVPGVMFSQFIVANLGQIGITQEAGKGILLVALTDCMNMPITDSSNITLSIKQNGTAVQGTTEFDAGQIDPMLAGTYIVFNVPAGADDQNPSVVTEVSATYKTMNLRAHDVRVFRDSTTATQLRPGF